MQLQLEQQLPMLEANPAQAAITDAVDGKASVDVSPHSFSALLYANKPVGTMCGCCYSVLVVSPWCCCDLFFAKLLA